MRKLATCLCLILLCVGAGWAQEAPPVYIRPAGDRAIVVLGDAPATVRGFQVYRKGRWARSFDLLTPEPVTAVEDAYEAARQMGDDFRWISRKLDSMDPQVVWRKLKMERDLAQAYALLSHGLRIALGRTWIDTDVEPDRRYDYRVVLLDSSGDEIGQYERRIRITDPERPPAPKDVQAVYSNGIVSIEWDYPAYEGGEDDVTVGFVVLRRHRDEVFEPLSPAPILRIEGYLNAFDEKVRTGETYTYAVVAQDIIGVVSTRVESIPVAIEDTTAPLVPVGLKARDRGEDVLLIWKMSPELDVSHYNVFRSFSVEEEAELEQLNSKPIPYQTPRFVDKEAPRGVPVYYRVSAVDEKGNTSMFSGPAPLLAEDTEPPGPVDRLAAVVDEEARRVELSWQGPDDEDLFGYYVYSGADKNQLMRITKAPLAADKRAQFTDGGYAERGLEPGKSLVYAVSAVDSSYNESSQKIIEVKVPDKVPPDTPSGFAVRPTRDGGVRLSWQPLLCFDLSGYRVYRSENRKFESVAELDAPVAHWLDEDAQRGARYSYYVTAIDSSGNESPPSDAIEIVPTDINPPAPPKELTFEVVRRGIRLRWEKSPDNDVKLYKVYRSEYPGGKPTRLIGEIDVCPTYLDRGGKAGYVYAVVPVDTSGNEGRGKEVQVE